MPSDWGFSQAPGRDALEQQTTRGKNASHNPQAAGGVRWSLGRTPRLPFDEWQNEVANDDTRKGYWEWVKAKIEDEEDEPDEE